MKKHGCGERENGKTEREESSANPTMLPLPVAHTKARTPPCRAWKARGVFPFFKPFPHRNTFFPRGLQKAPRRRTLLLPSEKYAPPRSSAAPRSRLPTAAILSPGITILFSLPRTPRGEIPPGSSLPPIPAAPEHRRPAPERCFRPCPPPPQGSRPPGFRMAGFSGTPAAAYEKRPERPGLFPSLQRRRIRRFSAPRPSPHRHLHPSFSHPLRPLPRCRVSGRARPCGGAFPQPRR